MLKTTQYRILSVFFLLFSVINLNAQRQGTPFGQTQSKNSTSSKKRKKDFSAIEDAEFEEITSTKTPKNSTQEPT